MEECSASLFQVGVFFYALTLSLKFAEFSIPRSGKPILSFRFFSISHRCLLLKGEGRVGLPASLADGNSWLNAEEFNFAG
ncbi:hypothetical protein DTL21_14990 [Bremerella cremea]|uniref:Uncharacterized protein n=1 Tax=Blastopirellula marina TaxID=124 RepID=A0A2S8FRW3_9BACT|nr:hypothetical protein C5Y83_14980 [Blastopirellula marina]RCS47299.1 hypothetical protein DTL21_14990 [Bremerella cremea]